VRLGGVALAALFAAAACAGPGVTPTGSVAPATTGAASPTTALSGAISIDGSSTVYPITEAVAEEFQKLHSGVKVDVAFSGTGGGFKKFCAGEKDANDASRPIKTEGEGEDNEQATCQANAITPVELRVAFDGLAVLANVENDWLECITTEQLKQIWDEGSAVVNWSDVDPAWPAERIELFGPGADSGTFDYFTEEINGEAKRIRSQDTWEASEDDNALVIGVEGSRYALGYFGLAYYEQNADKLKLIAVDGGGGCVTPSIETVKDGTYTPLSRPLFVYPAREALARPEVAEFFHYYLENANTFSEEVGYVPLPDEDLQQSKDALEAALGG
jgi:phosphate transport system substrate-binding protein